jgi:cytochrome c553
MSASVYADEALSAVPEKQSETHTESYVPGMGEIMAATQMRHAKLWFAGKSENWELASYELDEIEEGLDDAVKYHPVFKKDAPISTILAKFTAPALRDLKAAVEAKDKVAFRKSFAALTHACNACHQAASQGFIVIKQPKHPPVDNQEFAIKSSLIKSNSIKSK